MTRLSAQMRLRIDRIADFRWGPCRPISGGLGGALRLKSFHRRALKRNFATRCPVPLLSLQADQSFDHAAFANEPLKFKETSAVAFKHTKKDDVFVRRL